MVELLVGILILSFGIIPIYHIFTASRTTVFRSELAYMALHVARERLEELNLYSTKALNELSEKGETGWIPIKGGVMDDLIGATKDNTFPGYGSSSGGANAGDFGDPVYVYPLDYKRIWINMRVKRIPRDPNKGLDTPPWLYRASIIVRWQEKGEDITEPEHDRKREFISRFDTLITSGGFGEGDI